MFDRFLFFVLLFCNYTFSQDDFNVSIKLNGYDSVYFSEASNSLNNAIKIYSDTTFSLESSSKLFYVQTNNYKYYLFIDSYSNIELHCNSNNKFLISGTNSNFIIFINEYYSIYKPKIDALFLHGYNSDQFEIELYNLLADEVMSFYNNHQLFDTFQDHCHGYFKDLLRYEYLYSISSYLINQKKDLSQILPFHNELNIDLLDRFALQKHVADTNYYNLDVFQNYIANAFILFAIDDFKYKTQKNNNFSHFNKYLLDVVGEELPLDLLSFFLGYYASNYAKFSNNSIKLHIESFLNKHPFDESIVSHVLDSYANHEKNTSLLKEESPSVLDFYMENEKGEIVSMDSFQGKLLYVDIWASWCGPCRKQFPYSEELKKKFSKRELRKIKFIYISIDNDHEKWKESLNKLDLSGHQFISPANNNDGAGTYFQISSIPRYIIIDENGDILYENAKRPSDETLFQDLLDLIK